MKDFQHLFQPLEVGGYLLKNRIIMAPMLVGYGHIDGTITPQTVAHYGRRARGGASMVVVEATLVNMKGRTNLSQLRIDNNTFLPGLSKLAKTIKDNGAVAVIQLQHSGRVASVDEPISASERTLETTSGIKIKPRAMKKLDITTTISSFTQAAFRAKTAGFDMIELHGAFGHLLAQFLSPRTNKRDDEYGGTLENRMRFPLEVVQALISTLGKNYPIGYQLLADELLPDGFKLEEAKIFAKELEKLGVAYLTVTAGNFESCMLGDGLFAMRSPNENVVYLSEELKKTVQIPVFTCGKIPDPEACEKIIKEGKADAVALGRPLLSDPNLPEKTRAGRTEDIVPCIYCCGCIDQIERNLNALCDVNPEVGRELDFLDNVKSNKNVWIAGGGPAGMMSAIIASKLGHKVTLFEKEKALGGQFKYSMLAPGKKPNERYLEYLKAQVGKCGVKVEMSKELTSDEVEKGKPDVLIVATGPQLKKKEIPGLKNVKSLDMIKILSGEEKAGKKTLIVGGCALACEVGELIAKDGNSVTILGADEEFAGDLDLVNRAMLIQKLNEYGVRFKPRATLTQIHKNIAIIEDDYGNIEEEGFDTILVMDERVPNPSLYLDCRGCVDDIYIIGDAFKPERLRRAVHTAYQTALNI